MFAPLIVILFLRLSDILGLAALPFGIVVTEFLGMVETITLDDMVAVGLGLLRSVGCTTTIAASVILIKLTLFGSLVFALLLSGDAVERTLPALVPTDYRDAATTLNEWAYETLLAIYILQVVTAASTLAIGLVVFWALGYDYIVILATVAAVLQFIPVVGPSVLLAVMTAYYATVGDVVAAALAVVLFAESVDLLGTELYIDDIGGDGDECNGFADDSVDPSQP